MARIGYNLEGIGKIRFTFSGGSGNIAPLGKEDAAKMDAVFDGQKIASSLRASTDTVTLDLGFGLTAIENLALDFGFEYKLASSKMDKMGIADVNVIDEETGKPKVGRVTGDGEDAELKYQDPMAINVRVNFNSGDFALAGGVAVGLGGSITLDEGDANKYSMPLTLGVTLNPQYNLGIVTAGLVADIGFTGADKWEIVDGLTAWDVDSVTTWKFIPYLTKDVGGAGVHLGFEISGSTVKDSPIAWAIPMGFTYYF
jgi:hypothetical protein